jgi:hypothetical protein
LKSTAAALLRLALNHVTAACTRGRFAPVVLGCSPAVQVSFTSARVSSAPRNSQRKSAVFHRAALIALGLAGSFSTTLAAPSLPNNTPAAFTKYKEKGEYGGCKYKYTADRKGYKEEYKCK